MGLPVGYKLLEYIESSGTQYINTGYKMTSNYEELNMKFRFLSSYSGKTLIGTQDSSYSGATLYSINIYQNQLFVANSHNVWSWDATVGADYEIDVSANGASGSVFVNGAASSFNIKGNIDKKDNILIFCGDVAGTPNLSQAVSARLYFCKIYDNGTLVRDFVPCKNSSGVVGLWDNVGGQFYQNAGSGSFIAGAEIHEGGIFVKVNGAWKQIDNVTVNVH